MSRVGFCVVYYCIREKGCFVYVCDCDKFRELFLVLLVGTFSVGELFWFRGVIVFF